jgi:hypothetical protein
MEIMTRGGFFGAAEAPRSKLADAPALQVKEFLSRDICAAYVRGVYEGRADWVADFQGLQFSLGRAWYTHLEEERTSVYFEEAARADAAVERHLPGLQRRMREAARGLVGEEVGARPGWCGPGIHIFPARGVLAEHGGDIHFDTEGLSPAAQRALAPAYTLVAMLQAPESGGGLRVWDHRFDGDNEESCDPATQSVLVSYEAGDLVVIDSYRLHQIQPFSGERDRISATAHVARSAGRWEVWF